LTLWNPAASSLPPTRRPGGRGKLKTCSVLLRPVRDYRSTKPSAGARSPGAGAACAERHGSKRTPPNHCSYAALNRAYMCPILGADWERRSAAKCGQKRSDVVSGARSMGLTCGNASEQEPCWHVRQVVVLGAGGSRAVATKIKHNRRAGKAALRKASLR